MQKEVCVVGMRSLRRKHERGNSTLHSESELAHLCPSAVTGQTLVQALVPQSDCLHLHHLALLMELHMGVPVLGQHPGVGGSGVNTPKPDSVLARLIHTQKVISDT